MKAYMIFLTVSSQTARVKVTLKSSVADNCFERIARAVRKDNPSRPN